MVSLVTLVGASCPGEAEEEFFVAFGAFDGGGGLAVEGGTFEFGEGEILDFLEDAFVDGGVADDALAFVCFLFGRFELGFDEGDEMACGSEELPGGGEDLFEGDEREVEDDEGVLVVGEVAGLEVAGVGLFQVGDAGVIPELLVELAVADIDTGGRGRSGLEEVVGKAAGRGSEVEDVLAFDGDGEFVEVAFQFVGSPADVFWGGFEGEFDVSGIGFAGFIQYGCPCPDFPGQDECLGDVPGFTKSPLDEEFVEPCFRGFHKYG